MPRPVGSADCNPRSRRSKKGYEKLQDKAKQEERAKNEAASKNVMAKFWASTTLQVEVPAETPVHPILERLLPSPEDVHIAPVGLARNGLDGYHAIDDDTEECDGNNEDEELVNGIFDTDQGYMQQYLRGVHSRLSAMLVPCMVFHKRAYRLTCG